MQKAEEGWFDEAISMVNDKAKVDADECTECGTCVDVCPNDAITLDE